MKNNYAIRGDVAVIFIPHNGDELECLIDKSYLGLVSSFPGWYARWDEGSKTYYVTTSKGRLLHRIITEAPRGKEVDHIHHNGLDNRRGELRVCSRVENALNRKGPNSNNRSGVKGVYWNGVTGKWRVCVRIDGKRRDLPGGWATSQEAAAALEAYRATASVVQEAA